MTLFEFPISFNPDQIWRFDEWTPLQGQAQAVRRV